MEQVSSKRRPSETAASLVLQHVEAWRFQLGRRTETIDPPPPGRTATISSPLTMRERADAYRQGPSVVTGGAVDTHKQRTFEHFIRIAAHELRSPVIFDPAEVPPFLASARMLRPVCNIRGLLARNGYRVIEQRIPRRAYVILRDEHGHAWRPARSHGRRSAGPRS